MATTTTTRHSSAYVLMSLWIKKNLKSKEEILERVEFYHDLNAMTDEEYEDLIAKIEAMPE